MWMLRDESLARAGLKNAVKILTIPASVSLRRRVKIVNTIHWKYCRKRLENSISTVLSNSIVWKYSRNTLETFWKLNFHTGEEVQFFQ